MLPYNVAMHHAGKLYFTQLIDECEGNILAMAKISKLSRTNIYNHLNKFNLLTKAYEVRKLHELPTNRNFRGGEIGYE